MESSHQKQSRLALEQQLVKDLRALRDALTNLSLTLHDVKFLVDVAQTAAARELAAECIIRSKSTQHGLK